MKAQLSISFPAMINGVLLKSPFPWPHLGVCLFPILYCFCSSPPSFIPWSLGIIMTAVADLDRETQDRYELVVKATDMAGQMGGLSGSTTVTIVITDVNDNPPRFPQSKPPPQHRHTGYLCLKEGTIGTHWSTGENAKEKWAKAWKRGRKKGKEGNCRNGTQEIGLEDCALVQPASC